MRSLATTLSSAGWQVSGSDESAVDRWPSPNGESPIRSYVGHRVEQVPVDADLVIYSSAVPPTNCERRAAQLAGIPELSYAEVLGRLQLGRTGIGVSGTHGKSTTSAMLTSILVAAGVDPTAVFGAVPLGATSGGRCGAGEHVIVEACEYRRNFLQLNCQAAIVLNLEWDHCETFGDLSSVEVAFSQFAARLPADGVLVVNDDCSKALSARGEISARMVTFGESAAADWRGEPLEVEQGRYRFRITHHGARLTDIAIKVPGRHNLHNALAAAALAAELGMPAAAIRHGLESFGGLQRRCQTIGTFGGVTLVDDYAHHPSELRATLEALRQQYPNRRLWCVFQPPQAARTAAMLDEFAASLQNADAVLVAEIFRARESSRSGVSSGDLAARVPRGPAVCEAITEFNELIERLADACSPGDIVVTCGAGDIGKVLHGLRERL